MLHYFEEHPSALGFLAVAGAVVFFGSFGVPLKSKRVQAANVDPVVFQLYYSLAIFCSSFLVLIYKPWVFTYWGVVGAGLWVPASILSIFAINALGLSVAVGIWAGATIVVSFVWGAAVFPKDNPVHNLPLSFLALFLLVVGIAGLSLSNSPFVTGPTTPNRKKDDENQTINEPLLYPDDIEAKKSTAQRIIGVGCALGLALLNGSMMVPLRFTPKEAQGINYIISFGIGCIIVTPVCAVMYFAAKRTTPDFQFKVAFIPGIITGILWNLGNFFSIYATLYLGLTIGFPLTQLALVVSGLWGLLVFKELHGWKTLTVWTISLLVLLSGAALLSIFG